MKTTTLGVAVIGLGGFGRKRALAIMTDVGAKLRIVVDALPSVAESAGAEFGCDHTVDWQRAVGRNDVDIVVVSTSTDFLAEITRAATGAGKHVLCEKPFGRTAAEVRPAVETSERKRLCLKAGYNHRYHPAIQKAHDLFQRGTIGRLHFIRCLYGHGGRTGYDKEWRTQAPRAGGGQLLDQGVHALDLFRWFAGEFEDVKAYSSTCFWPIAPLEDNVFALLRATSGCMASLHASWTNWKNVFVLELFGEDGYLTVSGLGGHYGIEHLCCGKRQALGTTPDEELFNFSGPDRSLELEWQDFVDCIRAGRTPQSSGRSAWETLRLAESIYRSAKIRGTLAAAPLVGTVEDMREKVLHLQAEYAGEKTQ
jgi:predicted dehydrogenase